MSNITVPIPTTLQLYREHLREFFAGMIKKLHINSHKKTPEVSDIDTMISLLLQEVDEFKDQILQNKMDVNSLMELHDVANYAFLTFIALRNEGVQSPRELLINKFLTIDPIKGKIFCKKSRPGARYKVGEEIKGSNRNGYVDIKLQSNRENFIPTSIPRSHLVWWKAKGVWPTNIIDHKNRVRHDDRISNLRDITHSENSLNTGKIKKYPSFVGVYTPSGRSHLEHYGKFVYQRNYRGVHVRCAYYDTPEEAAKVGAKEWVKKLKKQYEKEKEKEEKYKN